MKTRSQRAYAEAVKMIGQVQHETESVQGIYKGIWHDLPVMVRTSGLAQTLAYEEKKAGTGAGDREKAHQLALKHCAKILGIDGNDNVVDAVVLKTSGWEYMKLCRNLLRVAPYFRHMAEAILKDPNAAEEVENA